MSLRAIDFQTIRSEGGLLPPDLLRRVIDPKSKLDGTRPEDYGLPQGERLSEVITQSWNRLRKHWAEFRYAATSLPAGDAGTGLTNDKWNLPLVRELGFGLLPTTTAPEIGGRTYAINRFFGPVPVHLVGCGLSLDRRAAGVRGAAAANPHGLVQEFVNRSSGHCWAIVANGLRFRVLRSNQALSRQSFLEFDLEAMFAGEVYSDFVLLWLTVHASRFALREPDHPESCWLEQWTKVAEEQGTRALGDLRGGVERALQILGEGFASHPKNAAVRDAIRSGQMALTDFHGQLLRVVYRLIFLLVAEDRRLEGRPLVHPRDDSDVARDARERYSAYYSASRLRDLASNIRGSLHGDLWQQFQVLVGALSGDPGFSSARECLALPALGSFLWNRDSTARLNDAELTNHDFLEALRNLAFTRQGKVLRPVDYRNLGAEELGGVYESLLTLTPQVSADGAHFTFAEFAGNERKTSGSYYTPDSLVQCLLNSALEPVIDGAIRAKTGVAAERAILALRVCDPAVGSGHFLVGAAHRLARHLARVRALAQGDSEPSPILYQHALRDVIGRCLYGVDLNPMAAELCRVSLWLEALEPGKPLSFLDHHIRVGNSLLGTTPELIAAGLPDAAFIAMDGDDKKVCSALKKRNRQEREGQMDMLHLMVAEPEAEYNSIAARTRGIDEAPDDTIDDVQRKDEQYRGLVVSPEYQHRQQVADAWCAAFVWQKSNNVSVEPITTDVIRRFEADAGTLAPAQRSEIERLSDQYQFFHWHLAFPEIFAKSGFDCVLGNPPWEMMELSEKEFFAQIAPAIAAASSARQRQSLIKDLEQDSPEVFKAYTVAKRENSGFRHFVQNSGVFPTSSTGRINLYPLFTERMAVQVSPTGRVGVIVPSAVSMDAYNAPLFMWLVKANRLASLFDFENAEAIFAGVHRSYRFCLLTLTGAKALSQQIEFCYFAHAVGDLEDKDRRTSLSAKEISIFSPNTLAPPMLLNARDTALARVVYNRFGVLANHQLALESEWGASIQRMLSLSDPGDLFRLADELGDVKNANDWTRLYCGKAIHQYDHRYSTWQESDWKAFGLARHIDPAMEIRTEYYARTREVEDRLADKSTKNWLLSYRDVCRATDERTAIAAIIPASGCDTTCRNIYLDASTIEYAAFLGNINSIPFDYFARQKIIGIHLGAGVFEQLPVVPRVVLRQPCTWSTGTGLFVDWLLPRVLELTYTAWELERFAHDCGWSGPPFRWDDERRFLLRCELDAAYFHLYLPAEPNGDWRRVKENAGDLPMRKAGLPTPRDAVGYILDTFPIVCHKDEARYQGDYRTRRVVLEIYDALAESIRSGKPYQSRVDPLPGPPMDAVGMTKTMYQLDRGVWPSHLHHPHPDWEESVLAAWFGVRQQRWTSVEDEQVFPWDGREAFAYALIPYLVQERPGKRFELYRDAALLASYPKRCETLLLEVASREDYRLAMRSFSWAQFPDSHRIRPRRIREALQGKNVLRTDANSGATTLGGAKDLPPLPTELRPLLPLILTAGDNLERVQQDALERAESAKLEVKREDLIRELTRLMVA